MNVSECTFLLNEFEIKEKKIELFQKRNQYVWVIIINLKYRKILVKN